MSYLPDFLLAELCEKYNLVTPYEPTLVNPASVDLRLGREFVNLSNRGIYYGVKDEVNAQELWTGCAAPGQRFVADIVKLEPGVALLATTLEKVSIPDDAIDFETISPTLRVPALVADVKLKSSAARLGLDHALAGWVDPGFSGTLTLEFHAHRPVELLAGKCYVQLCVSTMLEAPRKGYQQTGRYTGEHAIGAVLAREGGR